MARDRRNRQEAVMIDACERCYAPFPTAISRHAKVLMIKPTDPRKEEKDAESRRDTVNLLAVIICLVILIVGFWLVNRLWEMKKLQDCVFSGRRNCAPIETTQ
jgi:hypothetical protein